MVLSLRACETGCLHVDLTIRLVCGEVVDVPKKVLMETVNLKGSISNSVNSANGLLETDCASGSDGLVSFHAELPVALQAAMTSFIEQYPNWDQYRLIQAALAGFLVQNGVESRSITRLYIGNMFGCDSLLQEI